jgi:hypothetical protein
MGAQAYHDMATHDSTARTVGHEFELFLAGCLLTSE